MQIMEWDRRIQKMVGKSSRKKFGELLIDAEITTKELLEQALKLQKTSGKKLGEILLEQGAVDENQIVDILEFQLRVPRINFNNQYIKPEIPRLISENLARKHTLIPVQREGNLLIIAMTDPMDLFALDDVRISTGLEVKPGIATRREILDAIDRYYGGESTEKAVEDLKKEFDLDKISEIENEFLDDISNAPVVRFINSIIQHAIRMKASDIHIEPMEKNLRIRFRLDGELQEIMNASKSPHSAIVTRIKIMGRMDIAEKRIPQDGRVETTIDGKDVDLRLSILPTVYGEKVVIRLLGRNDLMLSKSQLGFNEKNIELFDKIIKSPNGIILVTGPTGSGKTTTLYAVLRELNKINKNIITVEDPVEYRLEGINQVQVNNKAGLTFANGLKSILRQDPDIIMIGEIRDAETAQIAVRAAITGHLVLSTIHTNDSASTISRLVDMGIEPYLVSSSVVGIVAQRLVRKICPNCRFAYMPDQYEMKLLSLKSQQPIYKGKGCSSCNNTGYKGRTSIHEVMVVNREIRELIECRASIDQLRSLSMGFGTTTLKENCISLVLEGTTTVEELIKATYSLE
jgi:type IV pilus assembly protein PilB